MASLQRDWQGFREDELAPPAAIQLLREKREALAGLLAEGGAG
jgi:hypothetical protein